MTVTLIGLGLIGGSLALDLRANGFASRLLGVDADPAHCRTALEMGLVDEIISLDEIHLNDGLLILAVPVRESVRILPGILDQVGNNMVVIDMGSTKRELVSAVSGHPNRRQFVAAHPMAGTEHSGPTAAIGNLFNRKAAIICDKEDSAEAAVALAERMFKSLFMHILYMNSEEHDMHAAYVSHISHISSFVLAMTVLEKEKSAANIFNLASGGFSSTVRLAKSSPRMWADIYVQNASYISEVMDSYIQKMQDFKHDIDTGNYEALFQKMASANEIKKILR